MTKRVVVLGGGGGAALSLASVPADWHKTAIIAVTDTGRSTGVARQIGGNMPAPGDIRSTIAATATNRDVATLLQHRFTADGVAELNGMALGNLMIAALYREYGDFAAAVAQLNRLAQTSADVLPVTTENVQLCAVLRDGSICTGEVAVRGPQKAPIDQCYLDGEAQALPEAVAAIMAADVVVIGPGSFYTTIHAVLLPTGIREALRQTSARIVFVMNTTTQTGQTEHMDVVDHVLTLHDFVGAGVIDLTIVNTAAVTPMQADQLAREGLHALVVTERDRHALAAQGIACIYAPVCESASANRALWNKQDTVRHDRDALHAIFSRVLD